MWLCASAHAFASVAVLVEEPYGDFARVNPAGHSAVYLNHICAASPTRLRPCREGELGAVVSRYRDVGGYDWLAMPLLAYLYAVDSVDAVPATMDVATETRLRDTYRREHLLGIAPDRANGRAPDGDWVELVGSAYDRTLYVFQVKTTAEQDAGFVAMFNDRKNKERYNGAFRNCADFARVTINRFYPHAVKRNLLADLGITTPKHVAHALTRYNAKHPEIGLETFVVPQVTGSLERSRPVKGVTECLLTCPRYALPIAIVAPPASVLMFVAYEHHGRFNMPRDAPALPLRDMQLASESLTLEEDSPTPAGTVKMSFAAVTAAPMRTQP